GRAPALQAGCQQFDPVIAHQEKTCHFVTGFFAFDVESMMFDVDGAKFKAITSNIILKH
ncbi:MAG: hypothetical protein HUJ82_12265, partial [Megasphaera sp.]|nr:hypothetical protein [Megasphaera sp.]